MAGVAAGGRAVELPAPEVFFGGGVEWSAVPLDLFVLVLLTRGLGQSALSVVSLALVGQGRPGERPGVVDRRLLVPRRARVHGRVRRGEGGVRDARTPTGGPLWAGIGWVLVGFGVLAVADRPRAAGGRRRTPTASGAAPAERA